MAEGKNAMQILDEINKVAKKMQEENEKFNKNNEGIEKMQKRLDELEVQLKRPNFIPDTKNGLSEIEQKQSVEFKTFSKNGQIGATLEQKGMSTDSVPDGGVFVPENISKNIIEKIEKISPMRALSSVVTIGLGNEYKIPREEGKFDAGWVGERENRPETSTGQFGIVNIPVFEMYAQPKITQSLLDDGAFNFENHFSKKVAQRFAQLEGTAFTNGTGIGMPNGFLNEKEVEKIEGKLDFDSLINLLYGLDGEYENGAVWMAKRSTIRDLRLLKDNEGKYIWQPSLIVGQPNTILGLPVYDNDDMPISKTGNTPIAIGNFKEGYQIVDKKGILTIRDPYTSKPWVSFYTTKRVGGGVIRPDAIKVLKQGK